MKFARVLSGLLHPVIMPMYGLYIIFHSGSFLMLTPQVIKNFVYLIVFASTVLLPLSILPLLRFRKVISDYGISKSRERVVPLLFTGCFYFFGYYLLARLPLSSVIYLFLLSAVSAIAMVMLISVKWKISLHMTGIGGVLGLTLGLAIRFSASVRGFFMVVLLAAGLLAYSRLRLNVHSPAQVYCGLALGFLTVMIPILLY